MNERPIRKSLLSITVGLLGRGQFAAYPTLERARELFPSGRLLADGMNDSSDDLCAYAVAGNGSACRRPTSRRLRTVL